MRDWLTVLFVAVETYEYLLRMMIPSIGDFFVWIVNKNVFVGEAFAFLNSHSILTALYYALFFTVIDYVLLLAGTEMHGVC